MTPEPDTKPVQEAFIHGAPREYWLPLCAFLGGTILFLLVDLICFLVTGAAHHPSGSVPAWEIPK